MANQSFNMEHVTVMERIITKMAGLEAELQQGFRRLDEKMDRFQTDLHSSQIEMNDKISKVDKEATEKITKLELKVVSNSDRLTKIETWQAVLLAKIGLVVTLAGSASAILAPHIAKALGFGG